jgi:type VI protein secretion system component VasF
LKNKETRTLENSNKHIDNWLSQQFEDFTPNPEPALWQSIDASLDRRERQQKFIWYWLVAGVLLLVVAGSLFQWNKISNKSVVASKTVANWRSKNYREVGIGSNKIF